MLSRVQLRPLGVPTTTELSSALCLGFFDLNSDLMKLYSYQNYLFLYPSISCKGVVLPLTFVRFTHNNNLSPRSQSIVNAFESAYDTRETIKDNIDKACAHITHTTDLSGRAADVGHPNFNLSIDLKDAFCALEINDHTPPDPTLEMNPDNVRLLEANQPFFNALEPVLEDLSSNFATIGTSLNEINLANVETGFPTPVRELDEIQALHETNSALDNFSATVQELVTTHAPQNVDTAYALTTLSNITEIITNVIS